jgi:hypothetical protein
VNPRINVPTKRITKMVKRILAIEAAPEAISVKPKMAATIAMMKRVIDHFNIIVFLEVKLASRIFPFY